MRVGVLDSGRGGMSVLAALEKHFPTFAFVYYADTENAPYSEKSVTFLEERARVLSRFLIKEKQCDVVIFACNTLTVTGLSAARAAFPGVPFIGTVPPVKLAADSLPQGSTLLVLATKNTVQSEYLQKLIADTAPAASFILEGSTTLVTAIEKNIPAEITAELVRILVPHKGKIDGVVIGCTHFSFVTAEITQLLGAHVGIFEPQDGIVRRLAALTQDAPTSTH